MFKSAARVCAFASLAAMASGCATAPDASRTGIILSPTLPASGAERRMSGAMETIYFDFGKATLTADARQILDRAARKIRLAPKATFAITGHTDAVGGNAENRALGLARAEAALSYLVASGVSQRRLIALVSEGEEALAVATGQATELNRRVTIALHVPPEVADGSTVAALATSQSSKSASPGTWVGGDEQHASVGENTADSETQTDTQPPEDTTVSEVGSTTEDNSGKGKNSPDHVDAGKGNGGGDGGDPGQSGEHNNADEWD